MPIWTPSQERIQKSLMNGFLSFAKEKSKITSADWNALYSWSIKDTDDFWTTLSQYTGIKFQTPPKKSFASGKSFKDARWFEGSTLNFAENLLPAPDAREVLVAIAEGTPRAAWTGLELWNDVARARVSLKARGVTSGDRVAGVLSNGPEAVIIMLATASLGAIWSSCSPDFGTRGIADRLSQVRPKVVFSTASYVYNGKTIACLQQTIDALGSMSPCPALVPLDHSRRGSDGFAEFLASSGLPGKSTTPLPLEFTPCTFQDPLYILFSSGTTGLPKCITHGVGGTLLQHKKELMLHSDIQPRDTLLYFTTCGWMMWNWMVSALACGAKIITFDGAPAYPDVSRLWDLCREERVTHFGTSPKFLSACMQDSSFSPVAHGALKDLRVMLSTGSPLLPAHYDWVYRIFPDIHLASISGGTDIISCFMLGNPLLPVYSGEIQAPGLGMAIEGWNDDERPVTGEKSELVCVKPFVSMPVCFWNDTDGERYHKAYFDHYKAKDVWRHGDFIEVTSHGGIIVYGRSDATLNPGGVRIGTSEIYRAVETMPFIADSLAIGQVMGDDTRVILFVKLAAGEVWVDEMAQKIKARVRAELTPRHVPALVIHVRDIPYTRSGKKVEMAVTQVIHGEPVPNRDSLANPESLSEYENLRTNL